MFLRILPCLFFVLLGASEITAQDGRLNITISPKNALLKIDGVPYELENIAKTARLSIELPAGQYELSIWHPFFAIHTETVEVKEDEVTNYIKGLTQQSALHESYLEERRVYVQEKFFRTSAAVLMVGLNAGLWSYVLAGGSSREETLLRDIGNTRAEYESSISTASIQEAQSRFDALTNELKDLRGDRQWRKRYGIPVMVGFTALSAWLLQREFREKLEKPIFNAPAPFTLDYQMEANGAHQLAIRFKF